MRPYVLFVGRITRQKGVTHLVDAIPYLPAGTQVVLCAGAPDTPEIAAEMRAKVEAARTKAGSGPNAAKIGEGSVNMVTKQEAIQLYSHCAVPVTRPSVYEPFGIINLKDGVPGAGSGVGDGRDSEVVVDGQTGYLAAVCGRPGDEFSDAASAVQQGRRLRSLSCLTIRRKGCMIRRPTKTRRRALSWTATVAQTIDLYQRFSCVSEVTRVNSWRVTWSGEEDYTRVLGVPGEAAGRYFAFTGVSYGEPSRSAQGDDHGRFGHGRYQCD